MTTKEITHKYIGEILNFPHYYGENLDALWDILSTYGKELKITFLHSDHLKKNLEGYGVKLIDLFKELEEENPKIKVFWE